MRFGGVDAAQQDNRGRLVAEGTCPELRGLRSFVVGDSFACNGLELYFMSQQTRRSSRQATARERHEALRHAPTGRADGSESSSFQSDEFDEQAAVEAARLASSSVSLRI